MPDGPPNPNAPAPRSSDSTAEITGIDDVAVLREIQTGNQEAMTAFFDRYSRLVYSVAMRILNDSSVAEDVAQELFIQIWKNPWAYDPGRGSLSGWLVVVARNRAIDKLRRRRPADPVEMFALPSSMNPAPEVERKLDLEKIQTAMARLPQEQRSSLEMAFFEGLSHSEIAAKTGEPLGTVKTRIRLGLIAIRKGLNV
jgi:RNA polymerase sigma-70 factor, ECF subfamily